MSEVMREYDTKTSLALRNLGGEPSIYDRGAVAQSAISTHQLESYEPTKNDNRVPTKFCAVLHWMIFSTVFGIASPLVRRATVPDLDDGLFSQATCRSPALAAC